jgi:hypothetical protein
MIFVRVDDDMDKLCVTGGAPEAGMLNRDDKHSGEVSSDFAQCSDAFPISEGTFFWN